MTCIQHHNRPTVQNACSSCMLLARRTKTAFSSLRIPFIHFSSISINSALSAISPFQFTHTHTYTGCSPKNVHRRTTTFEILLNARTQFRSVCDVRYSRGGRVFNTVCLCVCFYARYLIMQLGSTESTQKCSNVQRSRFPSRPSTSDPPNDQQCQVKGDDVNINQNTLPR